MDYTDKFNDREWEEIASYLSGESNTKSESVENFLDNRGQKIENYWTMIDNNRRVEKVNVDKAWETLHSRLDGEGLLKNRMLRPKQGWVPLLRVAAVLVILLATTFTIKFIITGNQTDNLTAIAASSIEKNKVVNLPDGSSITLNRNSELTFPDKFDNDIRRVELRGEAFFNIESNPAKPFIVDAGNGQVRVLGTSFNVITSNNNSEVEVFVETGKVMLCSSDGDRNITLEPGFVGTMNGNKSGSIINDNQNYMSWKTDILTYDGDRLEQVFHDLKRTHDISVKVTSDSILDHKITTSFNNNSPETIIQLICNSFNLTFEKEAGIYYLSK